MNISLNLIQEIILAVINIAAILIGITVLKSNSKDGQNRWFFIMSIFMVLWVNFAFLGSVLDNASASLFSYRLNWAVVSVSLFIFYYFFVAQFLGQKGKHNVLDILIFSTSVVIGFISTSTNLIIQNVVQKEWGMDVVFGPFSIWFNIYALIVSFLVLYLGYKEYSRLGKRERWRVMAFFIGIFIFIFANIIFNIFIPLLLDTSKYQHFGDFSVIFFLGFAAYATIKHQLFDVRLAIVRSVTYSLVLATLAGIYVVIAFLTSAIFNRSMSSPEQTISGIVISLILAFVFQPLRRFFDKITNRVFYKDNYNTDDFFAKLNKTLSTTTDLRGLLERVAYEIGHTLKAEQAFFFIFTTPEGNYISAGTEGHKQLPKRDAILFEQKCQGKDDVFEASMFEDSDPVKRMMVSHRIELVLPLIQDAEVIGYLCLGDHLTSGYTNRDIKALNTLSDELIIAIQNALAVHEIREFSETLKQKVINATKELRTSNAMLRQLDKIKDEFLSMASHQLRTPLTSVKGYISMVIDGDAGKITNSQKQLLDEAFSSSERMVHLINDFLNVSRIQTGKFIIDKTPVDLSKLVSEEIDSLRPNATARSMKFVYKPPKNFPMMDLDEGKIRQVVMNYADNAIYYSHENSTITVSLSIDNGEALFTVTDTGIGVPKKEREHLFSKFYRASNAKIQRPDGTGVGIYLAKKVIDALGGKIVFESTEGKGSTFGFRLPLSPK